MAGSAAAPGVRALLPYLRGYGGSLAAVAVLSLAAAAAALVQPLLVRRVLDAITTDLPVAGAVTALVALLLAGAALGGLRDFLLQRSAEGLVLATRRRLTRHLLRLPIAEYDRRRTGDLLSRVGADTTLLRAVVTSGLFEIVTGVVMVVGAIGAMALLDLLLLGVTLGALALGLTVALAVARRVRGLSEQAQARIGEMTSAVERAISGARTIRAAGAQEREAATVDRSATAAYRAGVAVARLQALVGPAASTAIQSAFLLVLGLGGARVAAGAITVGDLVAFILFLFFLVIPLGGALHAYTQLQTGLAALTRIEEVLALPVEEDAPAPASTAALGTARAGVGPAGPGGSAGLTGPAGLDGGRPAASAIAFDDVSFRYADGPPVLQGVSFHVPAGTRTALVGPSGAGKSTALALIERFYDVTGGAVRVGGTDVQDLPRRGLRQRLGYVEQEAPVLAGTLRENLLLAAPDADDDRLLAALAQVNLGGLVTRTRLGLDAPVGEGGVLLSGGERQRLAIARTLLAGPPILLLDEPTSNLDARNEAALRTAIGAAARQRTLLVVAHRLSTVVDSDQIVVLDAGRVVAVGAHPELLEASPLYRELAAHQLLVPVRE